MKTRIFLAALLILGNGEGASYSQNLAGIVASGATLVKITGDLAFTHADAPCWDNGVLLFADNDTESPEEGTIYRMASDGTVTAIRKNNGIATAIKPSGKGTYYCCEFEGRRVVEIDRDGTIIRVVADTFDGKRFDGPNDLVVDAKGAIYFSDARRPTDNQNALTRSAVYYVKPDGQVIRVTGNIFFPSGISLSPDGSLMYVANTYGDDVLQLVYVFDINPDGTLSNMRRFCELNLSITNESLAQTYAGLRCPCSELTTGSTHYIATSGADGCAVDASGNLYVATNQGIGVQVFDPTGRYLGNINAGAAITGCSFGGMDMMTLYVTAQEGVYAIRTEIPGIRIALAD